MKILHCINHFLPDHIAGTEVYILALIKSLYALGVQSVVMIPNYGKEVDDVYEVEGFKVLQYAEPSVIDRALQMGKRMPEGLKNFKHLVSIEVPDIIHFHELAGSNGFSLEHVKLAKASGYKTMMTFHLARYTCKTGTLVYKKQIPCDGVIREKQCSECWYQHKGVTGWKAAVLNKSSALMHKFNADVTDLPFTISTAIGFPFLITKLRDDFNSLIENCDHLVAISKWYMEVLLKNTVHSHKFSYIGQALPSQVSRIGATKKSPLLRFVYIGRISHFKGIIHLLKSIKNLDAELDIYGDTGEVEYIRECKTFSEGMQNVSWKGRVQTTDVVNVLSGYEVLCLPSVVCEMAPLVIQEAFAAGIPVLASDVYGNAEQVSDGHNGWLFKFNDQQDLRIKLKMLIENPWLIDSAKKNIPPVKKFDAVGSEYMKLYNKVMTTI